MGRKNMKKKSVPQDPDLRGVEKALKRSAANALKLARATNTPCYVMKNDRIVNLAQEKRKKSVPANR
ncbi:MAG TPA: hypothetical protein ENN06_08065 [Desulfobacteraceae bacterium]|nr:hypothetical protein [Desulfobacteraceae bacterium]